MELKDIFKGARTKAGLTQGYVSEKMGFTSPQFISNCERGLAVLPLDRCLEFIAITGMEKTEVGKLHKAYVARYAKKVDAHLVPQTKKKATKSSAKEK